MDTTFCLTDNIVTGRSIVKDDQLKNDYHAICLTMKCLQSANFFSPSAVSSSNAFLDSTYTSQTPSRFSKFLPLMTASIN